MIPSIKGITRSEWAHTHDSALTSSCRPFLILVMPLTLSYIGIITWGLITLTLKPWNLKLLNPKTLNPKNLKPFKNLHNWVDCNGQCTQKNKLGAKFEILKPHTPPTKTFSKGWLPWWETNWERTLWHLNCLCQQTNLQNNNNKKSEAALKTCN